MQKKIFIPIFSLVCSISSAMFERPQTPVANASFPFRRGSLLESEICVPLTRERPVISRANGVIDRGNLFFVGAPHSSTLVSDIEINEDELGAEPQVFVANTASPERILINDCNLGLLNMIEEERLHRCEVEQVTQQDDGRSVNQQVVSRSVAAIRTGEEIVEPHSYSSDLDEVCSTQDDIASELQTSLVTPIAIPSPVMNATTGAQIADEVHLEGRTSQENKSTLPRPVTPFRINAMGSRTVSSRGKISSKLAALNDRLSQPVRLTRFQYISRKQRTNLESPMVFGQRIKFSTKLSAKLESEISFCMQAVKIWLRVVSPNEKRDTFFAKIVRHLYIATEGLKGDNISLASRLREYNYLYGPSDTWCFYDDFDEYLSKSVDRLMKICSSTNITSSQLQEKVAYISSKMIFKISQYISHI